LALASETSNAKPYAIRRHFSHRKRSGIRRKRGFSGLFAVSGYRRSGFEAKIPQRSKALSEKPALFEPPNASPDWKLGDRSGGRKVMRWIHPIGISAAALVQSSAIVVATPTIMLGDLNLRAGDRGRIARSSSPCPATGEVRSVRRNVIFSRRFSVKCARRAFP
jgi:hypothetical protein